MESIKGIVRICYIVQSHKTHVRYLECHLSSEDELVALEETSGGVLEHAVRDTVGQILDSDLHVRRLLSPLDCHWKYEI